MGMLDDAFKKTPTRKRPTALSGFGKKSSGKRVTGLVRSRKPTTTLGFGDINLPNRPKKVTAVVPYGTGRQGVFETPMVTPPPKMSTSLTIFTPKQVTIRRPQKRPDAFDFQNPFGTKASQPSGFGASTPVGSSQPLGSSSGIKAGKRHKSTTVGGIKTPKRGGVSIKQALTTAVGKGRAKTKRVVQKVGGGIVASFNEPAKQKERAAIGRQLKKGIHKTLFRGKHRLI